MVCLLCCLLLCSVFLLILLSLMLLSTFPSSLPLSPVTFHLLSCTSQPQLYITGLFSSPPCQIIVPLRQCCPLCHHLSVSFAASLVFVLFIKVFYFLLSRVLLCCLPPGSDSPCTLTNPRLKHFIFSVQNMNILLLKICPSVLGSCWV